MQLLHIHQAAYSAASFSEVILSALTARAETRQPTTPAASRMAEAM